MNKMSGRKVTSLQLPPVADRVDRALASLSSELDWIGMVSPINLGAEWRRFKGKRALRAPEFKYFDKPGMDLQRNELMRLPVQKIEHPILSSLLTEKQLELVRLMDLVELRGTSGFLQQSIALFGDADAALLENAKAILAIGSDKQATTEYIGPLEFVQAAEDELDYYRANCKEFHSSVIITLHNTAGVMVVDGQLLVAADLKISRERLNALLQHEIGTHILTYFNGSLQPLRQLQSGLANYEATQEGLGVVAEYLCGDLPLDRLRTLAGRVVAVRALTEGADFVEIYRKLTVEYGISDFGAFVTATRVWRGGGLTKDVVYLRGLQDILSYMKEGHSLEDLFAGKFCLSQLTALVDLQRQGWLVPARLLPRYWTDPVSHRRLQLCAEKGLSQLLWEATS
jgi:uncharacterized protein (TIGR02421 family)